MHIITYKRHIVKQPKESKQIEAASLLSVQKQPGQPGLLLAAKLKMIESSQSTSFQNSTNCISIFRIYALSHYLGEITLKRAQIKGTGGSDVPLHRSDCRLSCSVC